MTPHIDGWVIQYVITDNHVMIRRHVLYSIADILYVIVYNYVMMRRVTDNYVMMRKTGESFWLGHI